MGQQESAPFLPASQDRLEIEKCSEACIAFLIKPSHVIRQITISKCRVEFMPLKLLNLTELRLSACQIGEVEDKIEKSEFNFPDLRILDLSSNGLKAMPHQINEFKELESLNFSRNKISEDLIFELPSLEYLNCFLNRMTSVPRGLSDTLVTLKLGYNCLKSVDLALSNLQVLKLNGNSLVEISENCYLPSLVRLDVSYNQLVALNGLAKIMPQLKVLECSYNMMAMFPMELPATIERVVANYNKMIEFGEPIVQYEHLNYLDVRENLLTVVPAFPTSLERFEADGNAFEAMEPLTIPLLKLLNLARSELPYVPDFPDTKIVSVRMARNRVTEVHTEKWHHKVKHVDLSYNLLNTLNPSLFEMEWLRSIKVVKNGIASLPEELSNSKMKELHLGDNPLSTLPRLPSTIEVVNCCHCRFEQLPDVFFLCGNLKVVDFSANRLRRLPFLPAAEKLDFSLNEIGELPEVPTVAKTVDFSHNRLISFEIRPQFVDVDVSHNDIRELKCTDGRNEVLTTLKLSHNPYLELVLEFEWFPKLTRLDICTTMVSHPYPIPQSIVELITSKREIFDLLQTGIMKFFTSDAGYSETDGLRDKMEDALVISAARRLTEWSLYGVLDGHGGSHAANLSALLVPRIARQILHDIDHLDIVVRKLQSMLKKANVDDGTTIALAAIRGRELGIIHLGDSRAVLVKDKGIAVQLTEDHKACERREIEMLKEKGSFLKRGRVETSLAITRSVGDFSLKGLIRHPETKRLTLGPDDYRLVICCDGVFDVLENSEIAQMALEVPDVHKAAALIKHVAMAAGSTDNVSVVVVDLQNRCSEVM